MTPRATAEAIEQFGDDLAMLIRGLEAACRLMPTDTVGLINAIPHQDCLDDIAEGFRTLGDRLSRECDRAEEADDSRRDNPLEPDFRRLA